jgi:hypothetical protein
LPEPDAPSSTASSPRVKLKVQAGQRMDLHPAGVVGLAKVLGAENELNHCVHLRLPVSQISHGRGLIWLNTFARRAA